MTPKNTTPKKAPTVDTPQKATENALNALSMAKEALEALATVRRGQKLSDTRARNVAREVHEQIKVIKAYLV